MIRSDTVNIMKYSPITPTTEEEEDGEPSTNESDPSIDPSTDPSTDELMEEEDSMNDKEEESIDSESTDDEEQETDDDDEPELKDMIRQARSKHYPIFEKLVDEYMNVMSKEDEIEKAESDMRKCYKDQFLKDYTDLLLTMYDLQYSKMHGIIKQTIKRLRDEEEFSPHEAIKYAVKRRKYMFDDLLDEVAAESETRDDEEDGEQGGVAQ